MIDQFRAEKTLGGKLLDFLAVFHVVRHGTRTGLRHDRHRKQKQPHQHASKPLLHGSPQDKNIAPGLYSFSGGHSQRINGRPVGTPTPDLYRVKAA
jgi:hypothetical protein